MSADLDVLLEALFDLTLDQQALMDELMLTRQTSARIAAQVGCPVEIVAERRHSRDLERMRQRRMRERAAKVAAGLLPPSERFVPNPGGPDPLLYALLLATKLHPPAKIAARVDDLGIDVWIGKAMRELRA